MILVIGSTGKLGSEVCRLLTAKKYPVRAMIRKTTPEEKRSELKSSGLQLVEGDIRDKSTFKAALQGVDTVITTISSMPFAYIPGENDISKVDEDGMLNLVDAAKNAEVNHFIYTSFSGNIDLDFPLQKAKRKVENHLQQSGMNYTILRPGFFMESWLSAMVGFDAANGKVNLYGTGANPVAYISLKDVAKFAVECASNPNAVNSILELGGPGNVSQIEAVEIFGEVFGKKIEMQFVPQDVLMAQYNGAVDEMQKSFSGLMICLSNGDFNDMKNVLKRVPIKLTSIYEYARFLAQPALVC